MAKQEKMRFYDPPIRSMKKAVADIKGDQGDIVEPIKERSRRIARQAIPPSKSRAGKRGRKR